MTEPRPAPAVRTGARTLPRRTVLRGLAAALPLPWLGAMAAPARASLGLVSSPPAPKRLVYVYVPNGVQREHWTAPVGPLEHLPRTLEPLAPLRERLALASGLGQHHANANGDGPGDHARAAAAWLTGVQPLKAQGEVRLARSADQVVADHLAGATPIRSIQVGCEGARLSGQCDSGYACAYQGHISWRSATTPAHKETSPRRLFDRLFRGGDERLSATQRARRASVLDFVRADAKRLERRLDGPDRDRLDAYLTGLRELEARIEHSAALTTRVPDQARPSDAPDGFDEHAAQLFELLALALENDASRVATFLVTNEGSNRAYPDLEVDEGHHGLSHHKGEQPKQELLQRIEQHHARLFAAFLTRLANTPEAGTDLLASTTVVYGSGIGDGNAHDHDDLPLLVAGDLQGLLRPAHHTAFPPKTPMNDLHWSLIERMGARVESFGDARGRIASV